MSTHRMGRIIVFTCDECDEELDTGETEFHDALAAKKAEGWTSRKDGDNEWMDVCDQCKDRR